jgi:hypothetical protein
MAEWRGPENTSGKKNRTGHTGLSRLFLTPAQVIEVRERGSTTVNIKGQLKKVYRGNIKSDNIVEYYRRSDSRILGAKDYYSLREYTKDYNTFASNNKNDVGGHTGD